MDQLIPLCSLIQLASFLLFAFINKLQAQQHYYASGKSSVMPLPLGFNRTLLGGYGKDIMGVVNVDGGLFFPILSSPSFNTSSQTPGFSLGFYRYCNDTVECAGLYMAVCAGFSGNMTNAVEVGYTEFDAWVPPDGFAAPVWIANDLHRPIKYAQDASLVVVAAAAGSHILELQLRDGQQVLWSVSNVDRMEMHDSGEFLIYGPSTSGSSHLPAQTPVVFQRSRFTDTLVQGQKLSVGEELRSNNSAYSAKLEKGGLVLYLENNTHFGMNMGPPPYWIFPIFRNPDPHSPNPTINQLVLSSPSCTDLAQPLHLGLRLQKSPLLINPVSSLFFEPLDCSSAFNNGTSIEADLSTFNSGGVNLSWSFLRLENDGRLYFYTLVKNSSSTLRNVVFAQIISNGLKSEFDVWIQLPYRMGRIHDSCDVPMACGPMGVCTPGAKSMQYCSSPVSP